MAVDRAKIVQYPWSCMCIAGSVGYLIFEVRRPAHGAILSGSHVTWVTSPREAHLHFAHNDHAFAAYGLSRACVLHLLSSWHNYFHHVGRGRRVPGQRVEAIDRP